MSHIYHDEHIPAEPLKSLKVACVTEQVMAASGVPLTLLEVGTPWRFP